jgi:hypothetical protein
LLLLLLLFMDANNALVQAISLVCLVGQPFSLLRTPLCYSFYVT